MQSQIADFQEPDLNDCVIQNSLDYQESGEEDVENVLEKFDSARHAHIKLSVLVKNNNLNEVPEEYVFTKDFSRIPSSLRWHDQTRIVLGRSSPQQSHSLDIDIRNNLRVSQLHCQILTGGMWQPRGRLSSAFIEFLKGASRPSNLWYQLPRDIHRLIWKYAAPKEAFYIQDLGSKYGTFIRLKAAKRLMNADSVFTLGFYSIIKILKVERRISMDQYAQLSQKWSSVGLVEVGALENISAGAHFSYIIICVEDYREKTRQNYVLTCLYEQSVAVTIGRHLSNHIVITHSEVSRKHCTLGYQQGEWTIVDGYAPNRNSSNGTWMDVRTVQEINNSSISQPQQIQTLDEIKVGETYIRFEIFNN